MPGTDASKWPPKCELCLHFDDEDTRVVRDRLFDLFDATMRSWPGNERTLRFGVMTNSKRWTTWDGKRVAAIETRIRSDLGSDGCDVGIVRLGTMGLPCADEFAWRLDIRARD